MNIEAKKPVETVSVSANHNDRVSSTWKCVEPDCGAISENYKFSDIANVGNPRCCECDSEKDMELFAIVIDGVSQEVET